MTQNGDEWQPLPPISAGLPVTLQLGSTGAGVGVGCGMGVGFITPINLSAVPLLGQAAQGLSAGLGGVGVWLSGATTSAQQAVRGLGVRGLDAGVGCGVLAGYYFGAGLMLKPSAVDQVVRATAGLAGQVQSAVAQGLQHIGLSAPGIPAGSTTSSIHQQQPSVPFLHPSPAIEAPSSFGSGSSSSGAPGSLVNGSSSSSGLPLDGQETSAGDAAAFAGMVPAALQQQQLPMQTTAAQHQQHQQHQRSAADQAWQQQQQQPQQADPLIMRMLIQQQTEIQALKKQNKQLREAVCQLDPSAAVCSVTKSRSSRGRGAAAGARAKGKAGGKAVGGSGQGSSSEDTWSE